MPYIPATGDAIVSNTTGVVGSSISSKDQSLDHSWVHKHYADMIVSLLNF